MSKPLTSSQSQKAVDRFVYTALMAATIALSYLLIMEIAAFSATLDALTVIAPGETFITVSRIAASLVILLLLKEALVALWSAGSLASPAPDLPAVDAATAPLVSVIVPAFNEGENIEDTLSALAGLDYPRLELIVVDDGSSDDTLRRAGDFARRTGHIPVTVLTQPNGGKWKALNVGIANSRGELVLCVDADSQLERDALRLMVPHFEGPGVAAVSGQVRVRNRTNLLTRLQALEYLVANGSARTAQGANGCVLIVPGPIGLFRRSALAQVSRAYFAADAEDPAGNCGPFSPFTFAEDFELSVMLCALGHRTVYEPRARSLTRVPETASALIGQRYRWIRGSMQVASRYRAGDWKSRGASLPVRLWMALTTVGDLFVVPLAAMLLLLTLMWTVLVADSKSILILWMLVWSIHFAMAAMFIRSHGESMSLALLTPLQSLYGAMLIVGVWIMAAFDHAVSRPMRW